MCSLNAEHVYQMNEVHTMSRPCECADAFNTAIASLVDGQIVIIIIRSMHILCVDVEMMTKIARLVSHS